MKNNLLDSIMSVLTYFDTSVQAYITPDQEPHVRKELERVIGNIEQADGIVRRLAANPHHYSVVCEAQNYVATNPKEGGEGE